MPEACVWDVGVCAVVVRDARVLFVRYANGYRNSVWTLPGGYAEHTETLDRAAERELVEEAGLQGHARGVVAVRTRSGEKGGAVYVAFRVECDAGEPVPDGFEVDTARFFSRAELLALDGVMELSRQIALAVLDAPEVALVEREISGRSDATYKGYLSAA